MQFTHFTIRNYKGIEEARLDLLAKPRSRVHTLIGLNESGKTTILEAMNLIAYRDRLDALNLPGYVNYDPHELIPISKRSNFNDEISLEVGVRLDQKDRVSLVEQMKKDAGVTVTEVSETFTITQEYKFESSRTESSKPSSTWSIKLKGKSKGQRRPAAITGDGWQKAVNITKALLPRIVYFPNFLFDFPDKIYLESPPSDAEKHEFYRAVLQDVLDAVGEGTNLNDHILARAKSSSEADKRSLESVLLKMSGHISETVFKNWDRILRRPGTKNQSSKELVVSIGRESSGAWYLQMRLKDGIEIYSISERSLGFRWFFAYLLLTQYRGFRQSGSKNVVFLLDEPGRVRFSVF